MTPSHDSDHPLTYRQREVTAVMEAWRASTSSALVGVGSVGKSNLIQHLAAANVQRHYLGEAAASFKAIWIDPYMLGVFAPTDDEPMRYWAGCELLMNRLFRAFQPFDLLGSDAQIFYDTYRAFQDGTNPLFAYVGLRYLNFALELFFKHGVQIVFMFDEFEHLVRELPVTFFLGLRGLRDARKHQLAYMTFSRAPLPQVIAEAGVSALAIEPFAELFTDRVIYVGPFSHGDAVAMLNDLMRRKGKQYDSLTQGFVMWASGGHAGLLRAVISVLDYLPPITMETLADNRKDLTRRLAARSPVRAELTTLWGSLPSEERAALIHIHAKTIPDADACAALERKGLVTDGTIVPPLFADYVKSQSN